MSVSNAFVVFTKNTVLGFYFQIDVTGATLFAFHFMVLL